MIHACYIFVGCNNLYFLNTGINTVWRPDEITVWKLQLDSKADFVVIDWLT